MRSTYLDAIAALGALPQAGPPAPRNLTRPARPPPDLSRDRSRRQSGHVLRSRCRRRSRRGSTLRTIVNAYLDEASAAVTRRRAKARAVALFGYPHAQENDAERVVRGAHQRSWKMNARNAAKGAPPQLSAHRARVGAGDGRGDGRNFGENPMSPRAFKAWPSRERRSTANVQRQTAGLFVAEDLGAHAELKGVPAPVTLARASERQRHAAQNSVISMRWERALNGAGQFTLITLANPAASRVSQISATAHLCPLVAALAEYAFASNRRMGPSALRRGLPTGALADLENFAAHRPRPRICAFARACSTSRCRVPRGAPEEPPAAGADDMVSRRGAHTAGGA